MRKRIAPVALAASGLLLVGGGIASAGIADPFGANRLSGDKTDQVAGEVKPGPAKNVILLIGDGTGDHELTAARNYQYGAGGMLPGIDALPMTGAMTTYSVDKDGKADYVPDSAATGTAWATGTKTYDNAVSVDFQGKPLESFLKIAKNNGLKTGNVSTAEIQDATPAVQVASVKQRKCYDPSSVEECGDDALDKGGPGSISEQLVATRPDLTLGGGAEYFDEAIRAGEYEGKTVLESAQAEGFNVINDAAALEQLTEASQEAPVLGLFEPGNMATEWAATEATPGGAAAGAVTCQDNPDVPATSPDLPTMTEKSIQLLDNDEGFFLQVEGASIDKAAHGANACGQIGETVALDLAVQKALDFAKQDGETLVIVTADHAHNGQIVDVGDAPEQVPSIRLNTTEGSEMELIYPTGAHSGSQVRVGAYGPGAANVTGLIDQTDLFGIMNRALALDDSATPEPTEPSAGPTEPSTGPTEPSTGPNEPSTGPSGEPTGPTGTPPAAEPTSTQPADGNGGDNRPAPPVAPPAPPGSNLAETGGAGAAFAITAGLALLAGGGLLLKQHTRS